MSRVLWVCVLALVGGCETQGKLCTLIGCVSGFQVNFQPGGGSWGPGRYQIEVTADGASGACEVTLPLAPCGGPSSTCIGQRSWLLGESGCALPSDQHAISGITFSMSAPAQVDVIVRRDGRQVASGSFAPAYTTSQPNGPGCEPTCRQAPPATLDLQP
jgi:hypothetical protein